MYSSYIHEDDDEIRAWFDWGTHCGDWTYPPIPFDFGDIITIDMRPFYNDFNGVIVRIGDNYDCCAVAYIYVDENGLLGCETLKHHTRGI